MRTWEDYHYEVAMVAARMLGANDFYKKHPEHGPLTDDRAAQLWRQYVAKLEAIEKP